MTLVRSGRRPERNELRDGAQSTPTRPLSCEQDEQEEHQKVWVRTGILGISILESQTLGRELVQVGRLDDRCAVAAELRAHVVCDSRRGVGCRSRQSGAVCWRACHEVQNVGLLRHARCRGCAQHGRGHHCVHHLGDGCCLVPEGGLRVCGISAASFVRGRTPFTRFHSHVGAAPLARSLASECATQLSLRRHTHQHPAAGKEEGACGAHRFSERSSSVQRATIRPALPPSAAASSAPRPSGPKPLVASAGLAPSVHSCHSCTHRRPPPELASSGAWQRAGGG